MRVADAAIEDLRVRGFTIVEGLLSPAEVEAARDALWLHYPTPERFFTNSGRYPELTRNQFGGLKTTFPLGRWDLSRLAFHPNLVDAAERYFGTVDLRLYKVELWAKYAGAAAYAQPHHRDYGNHTLVVPRRDGFDSQLTTVVLLSDVTEADAPTKLVPTEQSLDVPMVIKNRPDAVSVMHWGQKFDVEVPFVGPAGTALLYRSDVLHRASEFGAMDRSRFTILADFEVRGPTWTGKSSWPNHALADEWTELMSRMTVRERDLFGFPRPGDEYWNLQTINDVSARYPDMDMSAYRAGMYNHAGDLQFADPVGEWV